MSVLTLLLLADSTLLPPTNDIKITWWPTDLTPGRASEPADQALGPTVTFWSQALLCTLGVWPMCLNPEGLSHLRCLPLLARPGMLALDLPFAESLRNHKHWDLQWGFLLSSELNPHSTTIP